MKASIADPYFYLIVGWIKMVICHYRKSQHAAYWSHGSNNYFQTGLMVELYPKSLVRAIGKVSVMKFS